MGNFPLLGWAALQTTTANMSIFFALVGFGLAAAAWRPVAHNGELRDYVATRLGALHAAFVVAQVLALVGWWIFSYPQFVPSEALYREGWDPTVGASALEVDSVDELRASFGFPFYNYNPVQFWILSFVLWLIQTAVGIGAVFQLAFMNGVSFLFFSFLFFLFLFCF